MARKVVEKGPANPKIKINRWLDADFTSHLEVTLGPGSSIGAVERPVASTAEVTSRPLVGGGFWWTAPAGAKLAFTFGAATNAAAMSISDENNYLVAADLIYAWTDGIRFSAVDIPGAPRLSWVSGLGTAVLRSPGYQIDLAAWCRRTGFVLVDPAHFGYAKLTEPAVEVVPDEQGRNWLKVTTQLGFAHTFDRPVAPIADAIPGQGEPR